MKWTPPTKKLSAELCRLLAASKRPKNLPRHASMEERVDALEKRMIANVQETSAGCLEWHGAIDGNGYGAIGVGNKRMRAHRVFWMLYRSEIQKELFVCHACDNPPCVNPGHLFLGTQSDNVRDCIAKGRFPQTKKTHCPHGHPYEGLNLILRHQNGAPSRSCRTCHLARLKRDKRRKKQAAIERANLAQESK